MSLKRYATLLAFGQNQNPSQNHTTTSSLVVATTEGIPSSSSYGSFNSEELVSQSQEHMSSSSSISTHTTYYTGGLGQYHQQRGGSGSVISGVGGGGGPGGPQTYANVVNGNVNLLLGGAMLSLVTTILCVVCYCCHRNIKKRTEAAYRQHQHQWLEGDPNMEIYSVEQCYETSGLFLGDSTDGLSAVPALHHEPPPSYDAVVLHEQQLHQQQLEQQQQQQLQLQLQQQQQQLLMQRVSPPPGYRSSLDISGGQGQRTTSFGRGTPDGSGDVAVASGSAGTGGLLVNKQLQLALNAQSCCSLQRAEVESMWNAAAAAVAARSGNCLEMETLQVCKPAAQNIRLNTFGRRYLQQSHQHSANHYRRGCPLCGKFRYEGEAEDEPLTAALSVESGLNMSGRREEPALCPCPSDIDNGNHISGDAQQEDEANGNVQECSTRDDSIPSIPTNAVNDENDNAATSDSPATSQNDKGPEMEVEQELDQAMGQQVEQDLNNINENGIISLDMSKIIDRSGLPTYEGAIKLESSGYV
ncbi:neurogenic protein mastermind [Drosophila gunungcola]|uniref:Uncharacterized protein n=1 Tax=Drosophila gunungcola TaxID=103775 RepID=A0A9Q0BQJ1_9MUSC|nr:neurogenic protein mastermind [Drosophila gunungcola]XP_052839502.1 neurogenic protein mastermind [Drosophila gunungcola]KAI8040114.1 hypothetical protein M5D96_007544 [Drosophila gunungcola]